MDDYSSKVAAAVKETVVNDTKVEIQTMEYDAETIERMTVQQLRVKLRSIGLPDKGIKRDLVSALKDFQNNKVDDEDSLVRHSEKSSDIQAVCTDKVYHRRKTKRSSAEEQNQLLNTAQDDSQQKHTKRRVKQRKVESSFEEVESTVFKKKQKKSDKSVEISGKKLSAVKIKSPPDIVSRAVEAVNETYLSPSQNEPWTIFAHKKPQKGWVVYNPKTMRSPPLSSDTKSVRLLSWNVNGLRALLKLEGFSALQLSKRENFDVLCLQETKLQEKDVEAIKQSLLDGYDNSFWTCSSAKLGYSGTAIISRIKPLSVKYGLGIADHDSEGRLVTVEFETFYLLCAYVPNSGDGLRRLSYRVTQWDISLSNYMKELEKSKPVVLTGDLNCAHEEIDIYNPAGNKRSAGFTDEERQSFSTNFVSKGFVDTFRQQHPGVVGYTYWGYRHGGRKTNRGWRLDYFLVSESIADKVHDSYILPDITGSDHSPIGLVLKL